MQVSEPARSRGVSFIARSLAFGALLAVPATAPRAAEGVFVEHVHAGTSAERAGVRPGDVFREWQLLGTSDEHAARGHLAPPFDLLATAAFQLYGDWR